MKIFNTDITSSYFIYFKKLLILVTCVLIISNLDAQTQSLFDKVKKTPWTVGVSGNVVDDDGKPFKNLFNVDKSWNFLPYPTKLSFNAYIVNGFKAQGEVSFNKYNAGKSINSESIKSNWNFFSVDMNLQYELIEVCKKDMKWFDPYLTGGFGFTLRSGAQKPNTFTFNTGIGFNIWIVESLALNFQSVGKFSMNEKASNYLHHSAGIVYPINWRKDPKKTIFGPKTEKKSSLRTKY